MTDPAGATPLGGPGSGAGAHVRGGSSPQAVGEAIAARAAEEEGNAMKALENRTLDSKREMDIMAALDELQTLNKRQARVDTDAALAALQRSAGAAEGEVGASDLLFPEQAGGQADKSRAQGNL